MQRSLLARPGAPTQGCHAAPLRPSARQPTRATPAASVPAPRQANYTLMITVLGLLQVMLLVRQMEACATPALASRVSLLTLAHQVRQRGRPPGGLRGCAAC